MLNLEFKSVQMWRPPVVGTCSGLKDGLNTPSPPNTVTLKQTLSVPFNIHSSCTNQYSTHKMNVIAVSSCTKHQTKTPSLSQCKTRPARKKHARTHLFFQTWGIMDSNCCSQYHSGLSSRLSKLQTHLHFLHRVKWKLDNYETLIIRSLELSVQPSLLSSSTVLHNFKYSLAVIYYDSMQLEDIYQTGAKQHRMWKGSLRANVAL